MLDEQNSFFVEKLDSKRDNEYMTRTMSIDSLENEDIDDNVSTNN